MKAGKTEIKCGALIRTTEKWNSGVIVTGTITHPFGKFGAYDYGAIAGIWIDKKCQQGLGDIGNLFKGDFGLATP